MPRPASKTQADKAVRRSSVQVATPQAEDVEDIVPGWLTKTGWIDLLIQEDPEDIVGEIMGELLSKVMEGCFKVYIKQQLAPFSAFWAKSYLTQIVDQQLLCLDKGEGPEDTAKTEDLEPLPTISDTWAQGCVPVVKATTQRLHPNLQKETDPGQVPIQKEASTNRKQHATIKISSSPKQYEEQTDPRRTLPEECLSTPHPPTKIIRSKMQTLNLPPKPVQSKLLPPLSCSVKIGDVGVEDKKRTHFVPSHVAGSFYQQKDHKAISKLDPTCLPQHSIFPQYEILENNSTESFSKKPSTRSKLEPRTNKPQGEWTELSSKLLSSSKDKSAKFQRRNEADIWLKKISSSAQRRDGSASSMPLRLDKIELAKGVSILSSQTADINSFKLNPPAQLNKLRPIQHDAALPRFSVDQATAGHSPQVTPLVSFRNCEN
ncbi:uncharacterized protein C2orf81 homolog [Halichoeres trimaculatus]|uniref:uncharacterized protein C2orf81 homolog n=1 Tax=Halichoeres trimaculatus TaxID=147232 RepID=UPI003D9E0815